MLLDYAETAIELQRPELAGEPLLEALGLAGELGSRLDIAYALTLLARLAVDAGDDEAAGRWWSAVEAESAREPINQWDAHRDGFAAAIVRPTPAFEAGFRAGRSLSLEDARRLALGAAPR
jgi:hypothetical protein